MSLVSTREALFTEARTTPLTRGAVAELARRLDLASVAEHAGEALATQGAHVATVLAAVLVTSGKKLDAGFARALLPELDSIDLFGPFARAAEGELVELLLGFLDEARGSWEREALAVLLAADEIGARGGRMLDHDRLRVHARRLSRHDLGAEAGVLLGGAAIRIADEDLTELAAAFIAKAKRGKRAIEEAIARTKRPLAEALADAAPRVIGGDYTVRREGPEVGRNDPCPCGSGQKYKKCCAQKPRAGAAGGGFEAPRIDEATLHPEQASMLRASEIAPLDPARIPSRSLVAVYRRALRFRRWAVAERLLDAILSRHDIERPEEFRLEMLDEALAARDLALAEGVAKKLPEEIVPQALRLEMACLAGAPDVLSRIEEAAVEAVETESQGLAAIELALVLLRNYPALGILAARGALHEGRKHDSTALLEAMEDARDRALLSPFEPWWDFFDSMVADAVDRKKERAEGDKRAALELELRRARAESRGAAAEASQLKKRLEELDAALARSSNPDLAAAGAQGGPASQGGLGGGAGAAAPRATGDKPKGARAESPDKLDALEDERRRLRSKVDELQRIIGQGQEERRELRRKLTEIEEAPAGPPGGARRGERDDRDERDEEDDDAASQAAAEAALEGESEERPRTVMVPVFSERAAKSVTELGAAAAEIVLGVVAALAACRENAWGSVKKLTKLRYPVFSARAGIHHRVLFGIDERTLEVHEVIHRRDLEQAVNRLARAG